MTALERWALIKLKIRTAQAEAKEKILSNEQMTKTDLSELEAMAFDEMGDRECVPTECGVVCKVFTDKKIDFHPARSIEAQEKKRKSLILTTKEK